ncbi:hypothetical protein FRB95_014465 [Tulasnella sp. JGI-2019a]|nr:hypothetical protein FRB95_014465 [Tulasnella sp. JGI-2019a]
MSSRNLPTELFDYAKSDPTLSLDRITALTLFPDNGYFVAYGTRTASKNVPEPIAQPLKNLLERGFTITSIQFDASNTSSFIINVDGRNPMFANPPPLLLESLLQLGFLNVQGIWIGHSGIYAIRTTGQAIVRTEVNSALLNYMAASKVETLVLSPYSSSHYFAKLADGRAVWRAPETWNDAIKTTVTTSGVQTIEGIMAEQDMAMALIEFRTRQALMVAKAIGDLGKAAWVHINHERDRHTHTVSSEFRMVIHFKYIYIRTPSLVVFALLVLQVKQYGPVDTDAAPTHVSFIRPTACRELPFIFLVVTYLDNRLGVSLKASN